MLTTLMAGLVLASEPAENPAEPVSWEAADLGRVVLVEDHRVPLVMLRISFPAGDWSPWVRESGAAEAFALQLYDPEGSLRARADALAAELALSSDAFSTTLSMSCLKQDLPEALELVQDVLYNRDIDRAEIKRHKKAREIAWESREKDPNFVLEQAGRRALFAEGDARRYSAEAPPPMEREPAALAEARDALIRLDGRVVGFAGDVSRAEVEELSLGLLPPVEAAPEGLEPELLPVNTDIDAHAAVTLPALTQVYFALGRTGLSWDDEDYAAWLVADHVLGGHFYSRLYKALRHEGGETYGASTRRRGGPAPDAYALVTFTRTENAARTEEKLRATLETFYEDGITEEERAGAVGKLQGEQAFRTQAPDQVLDDWLWEAMRGLPPGWRSGLAERAAGLSLEEVNAFIREFYNPADFALVTVEPED